ncbi:MAG: CPBP family intramembrane metalloprotease [Bacteroidales bacterium]|nr:CPBP family intramembrane metalloprotease [Bacteroidales bacterium]
MQFTLPAGKRFLLFILASVFCAIVASVIVAFITWGHLSAPRLRIATVLQDIILFVLPPLITALLITRRPADFLMIGSCPHLVPILLMLCVMIASIPAMNVVIEWNEGLTLPSSIGALEEQLRASEEAARAMTEMLIGSSWGALIVAILLVGVLAGFSEELFFRGGLQRLMVTSRVNHHVAIWLTAFLFSLLHMQFFGFVPRLLLGAFFGYMAVWSQNLWLPVTAHVFNNVLAAISMWMAGRYESAPDFDSIGTESLPAALVSVVATALLIYLLRKVLKQRQLSTPCPQ